MKNAASNCQETPHRRFVAAGLLLCAIALAIVAPLLLAQPQAPPAAGKITTLIPVGNVTREAKTLAGARDMAVLWGDLITTERGGRVRVRLDDGSILSVGSQSQLRIEKHDAQAQSTQLDLVYGRVRATATKIVAPNGEFKVRTKAAVAGVVGTEEYVEASDANTVVIALGGGNVVVTSTDSRFPDPVVLSPGETTSVAVGRAPSPKRPATADELGRAFRDTESDPIANLSNNTLLPGGSLQTRMTARGISRATSFTADHAGIQIQPGPADSSDAVPVTITVARTVPPGRYTITITRPDGISKATLVVTSEQLQVESTTNRPPQVPRAGTYSGIRGAKFTLDASEAKSEGGQIVGYQWRVVNTQITGSGQTFQFNSSLFPPGSYTVELTVTDNRGQTATQQYSVDVQAGTQPAEILQGLAQAYESLQPNNFLRYFDEERFRNYAGFAAAVEDSFRNQLESMRVFQRAVNCSVLEEQDQAVCQADFELQFTQKNQPLEQLDASGNPVPPGATPPAGSTLGKRLQTGNERTTIRYERADAGWKIVDYAAVVSCPGGGTTSGLNVGSCVLAAGSAVTPSFLLSNAQVFSTGLPLGTSIQGSLEIVSVGGFAGSVSLSGQGQVGGQTVNVQFSPATASSGTIVSFTVIAPATAPMGFTGPTPFTLVITGTDTASSQTATANIAMTLLPDFTLTVTPTTSSSAPVAANHNSTINLNVTITSGAGFGGTVFVDFPNLPSGFSAMAAAVNAGSTVQFPLTISNAAAPGPAQITVRGTSGTNLVKTDTVFLNVTSDFTLIATSPSNFVVTRNTSMQVDVQVVPISGFAGAVTVDFINLPAGFTPTPASQSIAAGATGSFQVFVPSTATPGNTPITVRGTFATAVRTIMVTSQVTSIPPALGTPASRIIAQPAGSTTTSSGPKPTATAPASQPAPSAAPTADAQPASTDPVRDATTSTAPVLTTKQGEPTGGRAPSGRPIRRSPTLSEPAGTSPAGTAPATGTAPSADPLGRSVAGAPAASTPVERAVLMVPDGGCKGLRLSGGGEMDCDRGADIEFKSAGGAQITIEAEGLRSLGMGAVTQAVDPNLTATSRSLSAQAGTTYLVQLPRGRAALRIMQIRTGGPRGGPRARPGVEGGADADAKATVQVSIEWRLLQ